MTAILANFHFSHYKYMETYIVIATTKHYATAIKNNSFEEANAMTISA